MYSNLGRDAYPPQLLDDYLAVAGRRSHVALAATALRTGSLGARLLLARAAVGPAVRLNQLIVAARRHRLHSLPADQVDPARLAELARVIAMQDLLPEDRCDGFALYELAVAVCGAERIPPSEHGFQAQLAYNLGNHERARALLDLNSAILTDQVSTTLRIDLANPFDPRTRADGEGWFGAFARLLPEGGVALTDEPGVAPFDRLTASVPPCTGQDSLVTVIVTTNRPGTALLTALRSLVAQSWQNLEILVVDDASPGDHQPALRQAQNLDARIRILRMPAHRGTSAARNAALQEASGQFVAFQDCGDWSHPRRIECQVRPLLHDVSLVATVADGLRSTERLTLTVPGRTPQFVNPESLTFRREPVLQRLGYLDLVRRGGSAEYLRRIEAAFGCGAVRHLADGVYGLVRDATAVSPAGGDDSAWAHAMVEASYRGAYSLWHDQIRAGGSHPYLPPCPGERRVLAPMAIKAGRAPDQSYDVVLAGDWCKADDTDWSVVEGLRARRAVGQRIGVMHLDGFRSPNADPIRLCRTVQELINAGTIDEVLPHDRATVGLLVVRHAHVLQFAPRSPSQLLVKRVTIVREQAPYVPQTCTDIARWMFGAEPEWLDGAVGVEQLLRRTGPPLMAAANVPADTLAVQ